MRAARQSFGVPGRVYESGRILQICPGCSRTYEPDNESQANLILHFGCLNCRWKESAHEFDQVVSGNRVDRRGLVSSATRVQARAEWDEDVESVEVLRATEPREGGAEAIGPDSSVMR
jgi:hypothetical protein